MPAGGARALAAALAPAEPRARLPSVGPRRVAAAAAEHAVRILRLRGSHERMKPSMPFSAKSSLYRAKPSAERPAAFSSNHSPTSSTFHVETGRMSAGSRSAWVAALSGLVAVCLSPARSRPCSSAGGQTVQGQKSYVDRRLGRSQQRRQASVQPSASHALADSSSKNDEGGNKQRGTGHSRVLFLRRTKCAHKPVLNQAIIAENENNNLITMIIIRLLYILIEIFTIFILKINFGSVRPMAWPS